MKNSFWFALVFCALPPLCFADNSTPPPPGGPVAAAPVSVTAVGTGGGTGGANTFTADGLSVTLSDILDGQNFEDYADVTTQKKALADAKAAESTQGESVATVTAVSENEFYSCWAAAQWNNFAYHMILNTPTSAEDLATAKTYLDLAQVILNSSPASSDKDKVQAWITSNLQYCNTTHLAGQTRKQIKKALHAAAQAVTSVSSTDNSSELPMSNNVK